MNRDVKIVSAETLSDERYPLKRIRFEYLDSKSELKTHTHEIYHTVNGAAVLLYNPEKRTVILVKQFRLPAFLHDGVGILMEACAGLINENELPEDAARREALEETGYQIEELENVVTSYSTPGCVTERLHLFVAVYNDKMRISAGGGLEEESEDIEVLEVPYEEALQLISAGQVCDSKTIILLYYLRTAGLL